MGQITGEERGGLSEMGVFFLQCLQISPLVPLLHYEFHSAVLQAWHACTPFHPTKEPLTESPPPTFSMGEFWTACGIKTYQTSASETPAESAYEGRMIMNDPRLDSLTRLLPHLHDAVTTPLL